MSLNEKQQRFVDEYLVDLNATQAAIRAGYSKKTAGVQGHELLKKPQIQEAVKRAQDARALRTEITQDWVLQKIAELHAKAMEEQPVLNAEGEIAGYRWMTGSTAAKALEMMGRHLGMFTDRHELTGKNGGPVQISAKGLSEETVAEIKKRVLGVAVDDG